MRVTAQTLLRRAEQMARKDRDDSVPEETKAQKKARKKKIYRKWYVVLRKMFEVISMATAAVKNEAIMQPTYNTKVKDTSAASSSNGRG